MKKHFSYFLTFFSLFLYSQAYPQSTADFNERWVTAVNSTSISDIYLDNAVHINSMGDVLTGVESIQNVLTYLDVNITSINTDFDILTGRNNTIEYEIGNFTTDSEQVFGYLAINNSRSGKALRELEFIALADNSDFSLEEIDKRRREWVELCNAKDAEELVKNLYTNNAVYYNHRPVLVGHEALSREYRYMNNPNYTLDLKPLHVEIINENLVLEIGQCLGSYTGKYMLIWQKSDDGIWRILMDSNI